MARDNVLRAISKKWNIIARSDLKNQRLKEKQKKANAEKEVVVSVDLVVQNFSKVIDLVDDD